MHRRGPASDPTRLRQVRDDLRVLRPMPAHRPAGPPRLHEESPLEVRRRWLVDAVDRELASADACPTTAPRGDSPGD